MQQLKGMIGQFRIWGAVGFLRMLHYTLLSTWGRIHERAPKGAFEPVGKLIGCEGRPAGADIRFKHALLEIRFVTDDIARLTWRPGADPAPYGLVQREWPEVKTRCSESAGGWSVSSSALTVTVAAESGIEFTDAAGLLVRREHLPTRRGEEWRHEVELPPEAQVCGLGEHTGSMNVRGSRRRLWNTDPMTAYGPDRDPLYLGIPVLQILGTETQHLAFYENSFPATVDGRQGLTLHFEGGALRYYVIPGAPRHTLTRYVELTGKPPLPPRWALGYHQSRFSYQNEDEIREIARGFRDKNLPLSAIHLDIHYMQGFRVFTVDEKRFPDLKRLADDLSEDDIKLVAILDPGVKRDQRYSVYTEGLERNMFCRDTEGRVAAAYVWPGWSAFPDFTDAKVRDWWGGQYAKLTDQGICGFWNDMNEPSMTALWGEHSLARDVLHEFDGRKGNHAEGHNLYGLMMVRAGYEGLRRLRPEIRPFLLTRSGWAGIQRYAWTWTGDISSSWGMLQQTISTIIGLGLSGVPYSGPDIGGFKGPLSRELYLRWFELAAFLPFFRTHSSLTMAPREPWQFGEEVLGIVRSLLQLRQELMPYFYTLAWQASQSGHPLIRPLLWLDTGDPETAAQEDCFLVGNDLLVAPVLVRGQERREVRLPTGTWYDFWSDRPLQGKVMVSALPGRPPLFVRAGAVLPRLTGTSHLTLHIYPPQQGETRATAVFTDAGDGYGQSRVDRFHLDHANGEIKLEWTQEGDFDFPYSVQLSLHALEPIAVEVDGRAVSASKVIDTGKFKTVRVTA